MKYKYLISYKFAYTFWGSFEYLDEHAIIDACDIEEAIENLYSDFKKKESTWTLLAINFVYREEIK